jgi:uncharacterized circularly permuted ATP-grasp superfamily protein
VKVANALGSGLIESAAIMPFLPGLSTYLTGEKLKLPSVATWWCGQPYALDWVLNHLDSLVLKPAFPSRGMEPVFGADLEQGARQKLVEQLCARPHEFVAQEQIALSSAPVWDKGNLHSRSVVLRAYVLNTGNGWTAIPGGLVRKWKGQLCRCSEAAIARTPGCCGTALWIRSACSTRAMSRSR